MPSRLLPARFGGIRKVLLTLVLSGCWNHAEAAVTTLRVATEGSQVPLPPGVEGELYFIGREAIANAFRHAGASQIQVEVSSDDSYVRLHCDDGRGIEAGALKGAGKEGFRGALQRAASAPDHFRSTPTTVPAPSVRLDSLWGLVRLGTQGSPSKEEI
jgi:hypothetical protein